MKTINVGEAKSRFSELISRAAAGERFLIQRRERPVAVLIGTAELERLQRVSQAAYRMALALGQSAGLLKQIEAEEVHPAMAAFGLWRDEVELATLTDEIYANRQRQSSIMRYDRRRFVPKADFHHPRLSDRAGSTGGV